MENAAASPAGRFRRHSRRRKCPTLKAQTHTKNRMPAPATIRQIPLFFPNRLQVSPIRRVMPPFKGNARVNGFAVGREAGVRRVSWGIENITMQKENFSIIRQDSLTDS
ncbi:hypothetical protein [Neisseria meningitidis]|uniref:hypothetical protein n=1 Tax=Neisseria meningitidis TaxID=487 RepID=UPI001C55DF9B|nr:hypothetical protein [Neisseria meningitidis]MBW3870948.1 hypothetical protein [Neisseria meningitidis]